MGSQSRGHGLALLTCALNFGVSSEAPWVGRSTGVRAHVEDHQFCGGKSSTGSLGATTGMG